MTVTRGRGTYGTPDIRTHECDANVTLGNYCSISDGVILMAGGEHHPEYVTTSPISFFLGGPAFPLTRPADIMIGSDVWIGQGATIMGGVTVGHGAIIGARALVRHDVPPYAIVGGVPAHLIRYRFRPDQIAALLRIAWWDWPEAQVNQWAPVLCSQNVDRFIQDAGQVCYDH